MGSLKAVATTSPTREATDKPSVKERDLGGPTHTELSPTLKGKHSSHQTATGSGGGKLGGDDSTQGIVTSDAATQLITSHLVFLQGPKRVQDTHNDTPDDEDGNDI